MSHCWTPPAATGDSIIVTSQKNFAARLRVGTVCTGRDVRISNPFQVSMYDRRNVLMEILEPPRHIFALSTFAAITLFELGSIVCAVAMNMNTLIFGRALSGVGAAGVFTSALAIIAEIAPIEKHAGRCYSALSVLTLASEHWSTTDIGGYVLGGVFTERVSWRQETTTLNRSEASEHTVLQHWLRLDWFGTILCVGIVTILPLPLQWGGVTKAWRDPTVIASFCASGVVLIAFVILEWKMGERAINPLYMFRRSTQGRSAIQSGIDVLPFMLSLVIGESISGGLISVMGRYWYWLALSPPIASIGAGLLFTTDIHTPQRYLIGYQILYGFGIGGALQTTWIAVQAEYHSEEHMIPQSTSLIMFAQLIGGVIGMAITGSIFANQLVKELAEFAPHLAPDVAHSVRQSVSYIFTLPLDEQEAVVSAYSKSLDYVWSLGVPPGVLASLATFMVRNYDLMKM
ncbi:hypothetical protein BS47DRAFT_1484607 [Hydnum rufescens UP504]|uniref:Uncharacterized protein n=1 Tax=Hydnum rufescens UP504 TaxID=1448309 RepID=A0A9P6DXU3_9AGAM|nr:hypothetical protein BS47DRAFT_1484607 [Hydnum rufescens UP504]